MNFGHRVDEPEKRCRGVAGTGVLLWLVAWSVVTSEVDELGERKIEFTVWQ